MFFSACRRGLTDPSRWLRRPVSSGALVTLTVIAGAGLTTASATVVSMKSGMQIEGKADKIGSLNENPLAALRSSAADVKPIVLIDDHMRRIFVPNSEVAAFAESVGGVPERIRIEQRVAKGGRAIGTVGPILKITAFDEYGRRTFSMQGRNGPIHVIQVITEVGPSYTKVEGHASTGYVWDMRLATSSLDRKTLKTVLSRAIDATNVDDRLRVVRLFIQARRFGDALAELNEVVKDFPDLKDLPKRADALKQSFAQHLVEEIEVRQQAGQHRRVHLLLNHFPSEGIAGETLLRVRDMLSEYEKRKGQYEQTLSLLESLIADVEDADTKARLAPVLEEIRNDLSVHTLNRMADFLRLADDNSLEADQKIALAVSGWLLGSGAGIDNLAVAISLFDTRNHVREYLRADRAHVRQEMLDKIKAAEGGTPAYVARLVAHMRPPIDTQAEMQETPGLYELTVPGTQEQAEFTYYLQLPPEYDPYRRYPCVVTLNGGTTPQQQIDWWAGEHTDDSQTRMGQAARRGYIVLAPKWRKPFQTEYEFSSREHAAVLYALRDACQRASIDTDRVFLSGHSIGGTAAWDIGIAHPDLWAGVIPIVARADRYIVRYTDNAKYVPMYFVGGEKDGGRLHENGSEFDRYMRRPRYNCTVVQYQGRGHEHFYDDIQNIFDWMDLAAHRRDFFPREFEVSSMRPWDSFFWWVELDHYLPATMVYPAQWPPPRGTRPAQTEARVVNNNVFVKTAAQRAIVWLSPEFLDFERPFEIQVNTREIRENVQPDVEVLLEDVRTRGDRQNPFWAKVEWTGRVR